MLTIALVTSLLDLKLVSLGRHAKRVCPFRLVPQSGHLAANAAAPDGHSTHKTLAWRLSQDNSRSSVVPTHKKFGIRVALLIVGGMEHR